MDGYTRSALGPSVAVREFLTGPRGGRSLHATASADPFHSGRLAVIVTVTDIPESGSPFDASISRTVYDGDGAEIANIMRDVGFCNASVETFRCAIIALWGLT
jgi:hypothetical protein